MASSYRPSIVENCPGESGHSCGYCHSKDNTSFSNGIWARTMTVDDYQDLIDRGWRRSGLYCYKPIMNKTCCPMYTIRCAAEDFRVSKSQKKILKRFYNYLAYGIVDKNVKPSILKKTEVVHLMDMPDAQHNLDHSNDKNIGEIWVQNEKGDSNDEMSGGQSLPKNAKKSDPDSGSTYDKRSDTKKEGKSRQMKAKYLRLQRKKQKLRNMGLNEDEIEKKLLESRKKKMESVKTVEELLNVPMPENPAHILQIRLVRSSPTSDEFEDTEEEVFNLYKRYQTHVHKDPPEKLSHQKFSKFLVYSPLKIRLVLVKSPEFESTIAESSSLFAKYQKTVHNESDGDCSAVVFHDFLVDSPLEATSIYGSYHQQYWLDGKLIAVGVIDILPKCLSSVYFLYDPDYMFLSLGTYGSLREVEFVRKLTSQHPELKYYYMGFYIHSCVKMRYKAAFRPSYLLCPETYSWHPIHSCLPKLDVSKYSRLNENLSDEDPYSRVSLSDVCVLHNKTALTFGSYSRQKKCNTKECDEVAKYASLVGMHCARKMLLYRK